MILVSSYVDGIHINLVPVVATALFEPAVDRKLIIVCAKNSIANGCNCFALCDISVLNMSLTNFVKKNPKHFKQVSRTLMLILFILGKSQ